jgi:hypothetical protein
MSFAVRTVLRRPFAYEGPRDFGDLAVVVMDKKAVAQILVQFY